MKTPIAYLYNFGETENISEAEVSMAEAYLVQVWVGVRSKTTTKTFDQLRYEVHMNAAVPLEKLPPSSSSIQGHIKRASFVIRNVVTLLNATPNENLNPCNHGWRISADGFMLPQNFLRSLPSNILTKCKCTKKCDTKQCLCRKVNDGVVCTSFCHKKGTDSNLCTNR